MSEHFFSLPLARIRAERRQRVWRFWLSIAALVLLVALTVWLIQCVKQASGVEVGGKSMLIGGPGVVGAFQSGTGAALECRAPRGMLAMAPVSKGMVIGLLIFFLVCGVFLAVRKARRNEVEGCVRVSLWRAGATESGRASSFALRATEDVEARTANLDPLALPAMGMTHEELTRILAAMIAEAGEARKMVGLAAQDLSVEDYGDRLAGIEKRIHGVIVCLGELAGRVAAQAPAVKPVQISVKMDVTQMQDVLRRNQQMIARFVTMLTIRSTWVRGYHAQASRYRPEHGGYGGGERGEDGLKPELQTLKPEVVKS